MIPRTIHFAWLNAGPWPVEVRDALASWEQHAPQFEKRVWTQDNIGQRLDLLVFPSRMQACQLLRAQVLGEFGGLYVDADTFAQPGAGEALAAIAEQSNLLAVTFPTSLSIDNSIMGCAADLPGWNGVAGMIVDGPGLAGWSNWLLHSRQTFLALPGPVWNSPHVAPGIFVQHRRGSLRQYEPIVPTLEKPDIRLTNRRERREHADRLAGLWRPSQMKSRLELAKLLDVLGLRGLAVEIGTHRGQFAAAMLARWNCQEWCCVDPWRAGLEDYVDPIGLKPDREADYQAALKALEPFASRRTIIRDVSHQAVEKFRDGSLDLVYADGNHRRPYVDWDLRLWWPKVRPGGVFAGHDLDGEWVGHVRPAVEQFLYHEKQIGWIIREEDGSPATWFVMKPREDDADVR